MRNGNRSLLNASFTVASFGSYPTYEEWKHYNVHTSTSSIPFSSYPTYEEWKHV